MEKIKWKYYKESKQYYEQNDGDHKWIILKGKDTERPFVLKDNYFLKFIGRFRKLSSAKAVANLLRNG